ncbi:MAG: hypothetical protein QF545_00365 [Candidatus Thalassarchaeaceae archaeon]|nr:hypothetical protein [Candidatus Thalassarchaeaceae archaeon]MDP7003884.1 hypothetical protein [Candidatus Thalassarchaeaceae archaeon]
MCNIQPCPLLAEVRGMLPRLETTSVGEISGPSPPALFVGRYGYPKVRAGPSAYWLPEEALAESGPAVGDPAALFGRPLEEVAARYANLITGGRRMPVRSPDSPNEVLEATQVIAMSSGSVDVEMDFERPIPIGGSPTFDSMSTPLGPSGEVLRAEVVGHASIPRKVDSVAGEPDLLATEAAGELSASGIGEAQISRLLSSGLMGREGSRKLVPTRWGITATDDMLSKRLWRSVRDHPPLDKVLVFEATYLDNRFHVVLTPGLWAFHMLEAWTRGSVWTESGKVLGDWEDLEPRSEYAHRVTGAYYSARLAVLEHMDSIRRSGACLVWRDIGPGYWAPVGVWLIRETMREAMRARPRQFDSLKEAISYVAPRISAPNDLRRSWFATRGKQTRLDSFFDAKPAME